MKKLLLILMTLALAAHAHAMSDAEMKALIVGTWSLGEREDYNSRYITYQEDGTELIGVHNFTVKWDVKNGELIENDDPNAFEARRVLKDHPEVIYTILFLTKHELLVQEEKGKRYTFMYR
jgi:hypothetical protein